MKKRNYIYSLLLFCAATTFLLTACAPAGSNAENDNKPQKTAAPGAAPTNIYGMELLPLTTPECGRCHTIQYQWLKDKGGRHQMDCTVCHEQFHTYNPRKNNWDEIMPKCQGCHEMPHAPVFSACLECHQQAHAPKVIQFVDLEKKIPAKDGQSVVVCAVCHEAVGTEFAAHPSKHNTQVDCQGCHSGVHGNIPSCLDCHEPHLPTQQYRDCLVCHAPHSATNIRKYPEDIPNTSCAACHDSVHTLLQTNVTKHSELQCATCHVSHGQIPKCQDCHGEPHGQGLHQRFAACVDCHVDPHNLPVNLKK
jgi:hypothetical protein